MFTGLENFGFRRHRCGSEGVSGINRQHFYQFARGSARVSSAEPVDSGDDDDDTRFVRAMVFSRTRNELRRVLRDILQPAESGDSDSAGRGIVVRAWDDVSGSVEIDEDDVLLEGGGEEFFRSDIERDLEIYDQVAQRRGERVTLESQASVPRQRLVPYRAVVAAFECVPTTLQ